MYKIMHDLEFENGSKITYPIYCINANPRRGIKEHPRENRWIKVEYGVYTCSECGCKMTMRARKFKEEKVIE